jgi:hypothetical protein
VREWYFDNTDKRWGPTSDGESAVIPDHLLHPDTLQRLNFFGCDTKEPCHSALWTGEGWKTNSPGDAVVGDESSSAQADAAAGESADVHDSGVSSAQADAASGESADVHDSGVSGTAQTHPQPHPTQWWWPTFYHGEPFFVQDAVPGICPISGSVGCLDPEVAHMHTGTNVVEGESFSASLEANVFVDHYATQTGPKDRA